MDDSRFRKTHNKPHMKTAIAFRPLSVIAQDIRADWKPVHPYAAPYMDALETLNLITDDYMMDSGASIVAYFLGNAQTWKGPVARDIKKELKQMLKTVYG